jgi:dTDP-4-dehydrorhamnose 3,5-epimerase
MVLASSLPGVTFGRLGRHSDMRGSFAEAWRASGIGGNAPFAGVQANLSTSSRGVLRGLHLHERQSDRWIILSGVAFVALVDVRSILENHADHPRVETQTLAADDTVTIPPYVAHGFLAVAPLELLYVVTNEYDGSDERGFAWNDPGVGIAWPSVDTADGQPLLSQRDRRNPPLTELLHELRAERGRVRIPG